LIGPKSVKVSQCWFFVSQHIFLKTWSWVRKKCWCILSRNKLTSSYTVIKRLFVNLIKENRCYIWMMFTKMHVATYRSAGEISPKFSLLPSLGAIFLSAAPPLPLTWNPGSAPELYRLNNLSHFTPHKQEDSCHQY
jgi:hypothetical protein